MKYDIFISYRREGGSEFARSVKSALESKGYFVFLDFDELKDGVFDERILKAIEQAPVFMFILSQNSLDRCVNDDDWVRKEIEYAHKLGKHVIPVNKDGDFAGLPAGLPQTIAEVLGRNQYSEVMVGQLFEASMNKMIRERVAPVVKRPAGRVFPRVMVTVAVIAVLAVAGVLMADRSKASAAVGNYNALLVHADSLMHVEDSLNMAMKYVMEAEALAEKYSDTKYSERFGDLAIGCHRKLDHVIDSLFTRNRNFMDFYMARYRDNGDVEDKKKALEYLDKALELKNDEDLSTMRRILK